MNTLVTGGSGYLGTYVRQFFQASDFSRRSSLNILEDADAQIVENYEVVIHLAGHLDKSPEGAEECFRTNADGTRNIIRHMRPGSVFIYASTKDVYGANASAYEFVPEDCPVEQKRVRVCPRRLSSRTEPGIGFRIVETDRRTIRAILRPATRRPGVHLSDVGRFRATVRG
jgi:nucleoside-diphosphate-sugar epimerase